MAFRFHEQDSISRRGWGGFIVLAVLVSTCGFVPQGAFADPQFSSSEESIEFSARMVWRIQGRMSKALLFVKNDRYRIEPSAGIKTKLGYASVTIVRLDEQKIWYVISQRRMVVSTPLTANYLLPFTPALAGETSRTLIGSSVVGDQPALLYDVMVTNKFDETERYFEWVDPQRDILLKLLSQDRDWLVEYHHVVLSPQPDYYFEAPLGYRTIEVQDILTPSG